MLCSIIFRRHFSGRKILKRHVYTTVIAFDWAPISSHIIILTSRAGQSCSGSRWLRTVNSFCPIWSPCSIDAATDASWCQGHPSLNALTLLPRHRECKLTDTASVKGSLSIVTDNNCKCRYYLTCNLTSGNLFHRTSPTCVKWLIYKVTHSKIVCDSNWRGDNHHGGELQSLQRGPSSLPCDSVEKHVNPDRNQYIQRQTLHQLLKNPHVSVSLRDFFFFFL